MQPRGCLRSQKETLYRASIDWLMQGRGETLFKKQMRELLNLRKFQKSLDNLSKIYIFYRFTNRKKEHLFCRETDK